MANDDFNECLMRDVIDESSMSDVIDGSPEPEGFDESPTVDSAESPATSFTEESPEPESRAETPESDDDDFSLHQFPDDFDDFSVQDFFDEYPAFSLDDEAFQGRPLKGMWDTIRHHLKQPNQDHKTALSLMHLATDLAQANSGRFGSWVIKNRPLEPLLDFFRFMEGHKRDILYETAVFMESFLMMTILDHKANLRSPIAVQYSSAQSYDDFWNSYFTAGGYSKVAKNFIKYDNRGVIYLGEDELTVWSGARRAPEFVEDDLYWVFDGDAAQEGIVQLRNYITTDHAALYRRS
ncbi:unnamed protein product [Clonostachys byssicola]|uniref:Uncharacterized protein n=1 Tax=Clonostachys byssicola TaxID=160290 RepID=A0A9N9Y4C7_9HYPO|nr:unnamed protein product [Clonostachys byssicola]